jgi:hypothetical protein
VAKYPTAMPLKESEIADSSFIDELERSGFIDRLYAADTINRMSPIGTERR